MAEAGVELLRNLRGIRTIRPSATQIPAQFTVTGTLSPLFNAGPNCPILSAIPSPELSKTTVDRTSSQATCLHLKWATMGLATPPDSSGITRVASTGGAASGLLSELGLPLVIFNWAQLLP